MDAMNITGHWSLVTGPAIVGQATSDQRHRTELSL